MQQEEETLHSIQTTRDKQASAPFFLWDGLLYSRWKPSKQEAEEVIDQLISPHQARTIVLELAHYIPMAGHLAADTTEILLAIYFQGCG